MSPEQLNSKPQQILLEELIRQKNSRLLKFLPKVLLKFLTKLIHQDDINLYLSKFKDLQGLDFVNASLELLNVRINIVGHENIPEKGNYIFASNHPLGGLDGLALMSAIGRYREDIKFIVNDVLTNIKNLEPLFVPVNTIGKNNQENAERVEQVYREDGLILIFPAGLVSRRKGAGIYDLDWKKNFISKAIKHQRDIIPVHIDANNSRFFYNFAFIRKLLRFKFNAEMILLPHETFASKNKVITIRIGEPIPYETFDKSHSFGGWANIMRDHVYSLKSGKKTLLTGKIRAVSNELFKAHSLKNTRKQFKPLGIPIAKDVLQSELTKDKLMRTTNNGGNEIYIITHHDSPNVMLEIGRLRELTFRRAGGGTGKRFDIDDYDTDPIPYKQMLLWDPDQKEIIGGYRYMICKDAAYTETGEIKLATTGLFKFSNEFKRDYLPYMVELGRSFIQPAYQSTKSSRKSIFALDNLWDGLGALAIDHPELKYFFGKVTMYLHYNQKARDLVLYFFNKHFADPDNLVIPHKPLTYHSDEESLKEILTANDYQEDYKLLFKRVRELKENIPPLINSYMNLSSSMRTFGTSLNATFGDVEETGILITFADIYEAKIERHLKSYIAYKSQQQ